MSTTHDLDRLKALIDGVIAVSITLLALDIHLTPPLHGLSEAALLQQFINIWPKYLSYAVSFIVVGVNWMSHQRKFRHIVRADNGLAWINMLFLMTVGLVPFTTSVVSESFGHIATTVYAADMLVTSFMLWLIWRYADRRGLVDPRLPRAEHRREAALGLMSMSVFVVSIAVAQFYPPAAIALLAVLLVPSILWRAPAAGG